MIIVVGTTSDLKIQAVEAVFPGEEIRGVKTVSGVPEQPLESETELGALNRLHCAKKLKPYADMYIGIENGLFFEGGNYIDKAVVALQNKDGEQHIAYSEGVIFPMDCFLEAQHRGFDKITVGQIMFERNVINKKEDPHIDLVGTSRVAFLIDTISAGLEQFNNKPSLNQSI